IDRIMALSAAATEFRAALDALNITQRHAAQLFAVNPRHIRRWRSGDRRVPHAVGIVLRLLAMGAVTIDQIEQAAVPALARTNGSAQPEPPREAAVPLASLASSPRTNGAEPEPLAPLEEVPAALAVCALAPKTCCWPLGDPQRPGFHFCGAVTEKGPY